MVTTPWSKLKPPNPEQEYVAVTTYLPRPRYWNIFSFFRQSNRIEKQLKTSPGAIAYSVRAQLFGKKAWTVSIWEDEGTVKEFTKTGEHLKAMGTFPLGHGAKFVRWKIRGSEIPPSWTRALEELEKGTNLLRTG